MRFFTTALAAAAFFIISAASSYGASPIAAMELGKNVIVVEKSSHTLYIYGADKKPVKEFQVTTGKNRGDKKKRGDLKTPEGVYFFVDVIDGKTLPAEYGIMAITTDYPNPADKKAKKTGGGIWIHSTDNPRRIVDTPFDTKGCVVANDKDVLEIAGYIMLNQTPMVIADRLSGSAAREGDRAAAAAALLKNGLIKNEAEPMDVIRTGKNLVTAAGKNVFYLAPKGKGYEVIARKTLGETKPVNALPAYVSAKDSLKEKRQ